MYEYTCKHENSSKLTATIKELIKFIVLINLKNNQKTFERFITKSQSIEFTSYFENWMITKLTRVLTSRKFGE